LPVTCAKFSAIKIAIAMSRHSGEF